MRSQSDMSLRVTMSWSEGSASGSCRVCDAAVTVRVTLVPSTFGGSAGCDADMTVGATLRGSVVTVRAVSRVAWMTLSAYAEGGGGPVSRAPGLLPSRSMSGRAAGERRWRDSRSRAVVAGEAWLEWAVAGWLVLTAVAAAGSAWLDCTAAGSFKWAAAGWLVLA